MLIGVVGANGRLGCSSSSNRRRRDGFRKLSDLVECCSRNKTVCGRAENADDAYRSFKAGHIIADEDPVTVADGLKVPLKDLTWHFVSKYVEDILIATEQEIIDAMKLIWERMKIVIEPSSAVPLATILKNKNIFAGKRVGVIITGGNVDLNKLPWMSS